MTQLTNLRGVVRGRTIELEEPVAVPDGETVTVKISRTMQPLPDKLPLGEGIRRSFGAWADDAEQVDEFLEWNRQQRKHLALRSSHELLVVEDQKTAGMRPRSFQSN